MTNKKLGLLLAPLIPLTAIGVVEVARAVSAMTQPAPVEIVHVRDARVPREAHVAPSVTFVQPAPTPTPAPPPPMPMATA